LNDLLKLDENDQRKTLGDMLFPKVNLYADELAPKITGMLIDFKVLKVQDVVKLMEHEESLHEKIMEGRNFFRAMK